MENQEKLDELSQQFIAKLGLPEQKPARPFVVAIIGLVGSGRTTAAKQIAANIPGAVLVQANSVRFLLKQIALPWGQNVREILKQVGQNLLKQGYGVIFDGNAADEADRKNIAEIVTETGAKSFYIGIMIDPEIAKQREQAKYSDSSWISSFEDFRVNTPEKMLKNIDDRAELHRNLKSENIPNLIAEIDNNEPLDNLQSQVKQVVKKLKAAL